MILKNIVSPLKGQVISVEAVPDEVFSKKVLGDGCAILPENGNIYSPVDGVVTSVAETNHAYGFMSDDGMEILVHFGIETVSLKGEGFVPKVKVGDRVARGQVIGYMGESGNATAPCLHFEVRVNGDRVNPLKYVNKSDIVTPES